jgi:Zn-dependent M28 family amino/carboxypeptidase
MIRPVTSQVKNVLSDLVFDTNQAMAHLYQFATVIGPRKGGTAAESAAAQYGVDYLTGLGYSPTLMDVPLPNGTMSHNVVAVKPGLSPLTIVVGGHMDSKVSTTVASPGGNDNASGSATVLELARALKDATLVPTVVFVLFGQEETVAGATDDHHWGSRAYVAAMTVGERADLVGMISVDMVGYGQIFHYRTMERGPRAMRDLMQMYASAVKANIVYLKDSSRNGYSDHEPFELSGYPAAWLEWREDPAYHSTGDTYAHCSAACVQRAGVFALGFLADLEMSDLYNLRVAKY